MKYVDAGPEPLLRVQNMDVSLGSGKKVIEDLNLTVHPGEIVAVVGESGSGKSVTALAITQLLPRALKATRGQVWFQGVDILAQSEAELNDLRGGDISMLFQQPQAMLDPSARVHTQVSEPLRHHRGVRGKAAFREVVTLMKSVGIPDPEKRAKAFSHELSGGMAQRVMMASALAGDPKLLIADEPTTALDVTVQAQILRLLAEKRDQYGLSILLITHDFAVVSAIADRVVVMYGGRVMEEGPIGQLMSAPQHPYTKALIQCSLLNTDGSGRLPSIPGSSVQALSINSGCRFADRCALAEADADLRALCIAEEPALHPTGEGCVARCHACGNDPAKVGALA